MSVLSVFLNKPKENHEERAVFWHFPHYLQGVNGGKVIPPFGSDTPYFRATPSTAVRMGDWKLIYFFETASGELYNLANDRAEQKNLAKINRPKYKEMMNQVKAWQKATKAPG